MAMLSSRQRRHLPSTSFALPGRRFPIHDEAHAHNALARVAQYGSKSEIARVRAAVHKRYPSIGQGA